jgi:hypothetical protein
MIMKTFNTRDFPLAAYLLSCGISLIHHDRADNVSVFGFPESNKVSSLVADFYGSRASVNPLSYAQSFRMLKSIMYANPVTTNDIISHHARNSQ